MIKEGVLSTADAFNMWGQVFILNSDLEDYFKHYNQDKELYIHYSFIEDNFPALFPDVYLDVIYQYKSSHLKQRKEVFPAKKWKRQ